MSKPPRRADEFRIASRTAKSNDLLCRSSFQKWKESVDGKDDTDDVHIKL